MAAPAPGPSCGRDRDGRAPRVDELATRRGSRCQAPPPAAASASAAPTGPPTGLPVLHMTNFHATSNLGTQVDIHNLAHKLKAAERQVLPGFELQFKTVKKNIEDEQKAD